MAAPVFLPARRQWRPIIGLLAACSLMLASVPPVRAAGQPESNLFMWQVVGPSDSGASPDYLVGTIHLAMAADHTLPNVALQCLAQSTSFVMEADTDTLRPETLVPFLFRQDGVSNETLLSVPAWQRTLTQAKIVGFGSDQVARMEPWFLTTFLGIGPNDPNRSRDMLLRREAERQHVPVSYLEKAEDQLRMMQSLPAPYFFQQIEDLEETTAHNQELLQAYDRGDLNGIATATFDPTEMSRFPLVFQHLFYDRNDRWMPEVERLCQTQRAFIAVGLGHLIGDQGLLRRLAAKGYRITPLIPAPPAKTR